MGLDDKISNKTEDLGGKAKEAAGSATGNKDLENEGKGDQVSSAVKDGAEIKAGQQVVCGLDAHTEPDPASNIKDKLTGH